MREAVFLRLVDCAEKDEALEGAIASLNAKRNPSNTFLLDPTLFSQIPESSFIYWVSKYVRMRFTELPRLETRGFRARRGPSTGDDARRLRLWWEMSPNHVGREQGWVPYAKGGSHSPYYSHIHLLVAWDESRHTFKDFYGRPGRMIEKLESVDQFFKAGLTWPRRPHRRGGFSSVPREVIFSDNGPMLFLESEQLMLRRSSVESGYG